MSVISHMGDTARDSTTKSYKNLTLQDSLIAVAVYAAQIDPHDPSKDIKRIEDLAIKNTLFKEKPEALRARINKFVNSMGTGDPLDTVKRAAKSLTPKYRKTAFKWATQLILADILYIDMIEIIDFTTL
ncbi:MAG: hypothetical protein P8185_02120 [Deltaproteobacteria bacterium]